MTRYDQLVFSLQVFNRHRLRSSLILLAISIGVAAVILLTGLGEGARRYIDREFSALGNQLLIVLPGKKETTGGMPPLFGASPRDLSLEDAQALTRIPGLLAIAPIIAGNVEAKYQARLREIVTIGSTPDFFIVRQLSAASGQLLPESSYQRATPVVVLGAKLKRELFGEANAIGEWLRLANYRYRIIGIMQERGESIGLDMSDVAVIPLRSAEQLFNSPSLFRIIVSVNEASAIDSIQKQIVEIIKSRHDNEEDFTIISQDAVLGSFNSILHTFTLIVAAIASISLLVAGILIMNVSLISVSQRRKEIGLLKAIGATNSLIKQLFLGESLLLTIAGSIGGIIVAQTILFSGRELYPNLPLHAPIWAVVAATTTAIGCGLLFSWWPAQQAAKLHPVLAMRGDS